MQFASFKTSFLRKLVPTSPSFRINQFHRALNQPKAISPKLKTPNVFQAHRFLYNPSKSNLFVCNPLSLSSSKRQFSLTKVVHCEIARNAKQTTIDSLASHIATQPALPNDVAGESWMAFGQIGDLFEWLHNATGLPYWEVILLSTLALRIVLLPITIICLRNASVMQRQAPEVQKLQGQLHALNANMDITQAAKAEAMSVLTTRLSNITFNSLKTFGWTYIQIPPMAMFFLGIQSMARKYPGMHEGGILWFRDLADFDPYCRLAILSAMTMFLSMEFGGEALKKMRPLYLILVVVMVAFTYQFPQGLHLYWSSSMIISIAFSLLLRKTILRTYFGILAPPDPEKVEKNTFYQGILEAKKQQLPLKQSTKDVTN